MIKRQSILPLTGRPCKLHFRRFDPAIKVQIHDYTVICKAVYIRTILHCDLRMLPNVTKVATLVTFLGLKAYFSGFRRSHR